MKNKKFWTMFRKHVVKASLLSWIISLTVLLTVGYAFKSAKAQRATKPPIAPTSTPPLRQISKHVVLISISGMGADLFQKNSQALPYLNSLRNKGTVCVSVESVYPSTSAPALATLVTGLLPADHSVFALPQEVSEDEKRANTQASTNGSTSFPFKQPPLWETLKASKLTTTCIGSPFEQSNNQNAQSREMPLGQDSLSPVWLKQKNQVLTRVLQQDQTNLQQAIAAWEKERPNLLWLHLSSLELSQIIADGASQEMATALQMLNQGIQHLVEAIQKDNSPAPATFFVVGDHGMAHVEKEFNLNVLLAKKGWLTLNAAGQITKWRGMAKPFGGSAAIFVKSQAEEKELAGLLRQMYETPDSPIWRILNRQEVSRLGGDSNAAYYVDAAPGYQMGNATQGALISKTRLQSSAGYLPQRTEMRSIMLAFGQGIKTGKTVEYARVTDIAPTIAYFFGIKPKATRGRVLSEITAP